MGWLPRPWEQWHGDPPLAEARCIVGAGITGGTAPLSCGSGLEAQRCCTPSTAAFLPHPCVAMTSVSPLMASSLFLGLKVVLTIGMVLAITLTADRAGARVAGMLVGLPLGVGLTLFFLGIEQGVSFAAEGSVWTIDGILACLGFCWCYRSGALLLARSDGAGLFLSCSAGLIGYFATAVAAPMLLPTGLVSRIMVVAMLIMAPAIAFRRGSGRGITSRLEPSWGMLLARAGFAALVILVVTALASAMGPMWSGLFSAFPTIILPSVMILHFRYGVAGVIAFFRDTPLVMPAIIVFSLTVHWSFPAFGVGRGIVVSYAAAFLYLAAYEFGLRRLFEWLLPAADH